jgi:deoxyadenosine/deoxycytidine kinase
MPIIVAIEGIVGAGKSTLLNYIEKKATIGSKRIVVVQENVSDWVEEGILQQYYEDPERFAFCFQLYVLMTRAQLIDRTVEENPNALIVTERTSRSDYMFAYMLYNNKKISEVEFKTYQMVYKKLNKQPISASILLNFPAEKCLQRCSERNRKGEENLTLEYLQEMEEYVKEFFEDDRVRPKLTIDDEKDACFQTILFIDTIVYEEEQKIFRIFCVRASIVSAIFLVLSNYFFSALFV